MEPVGRRVKPMPPAVLRASMRNRSERVMLSSSMPVISVTWVTRRVPSARRAMMTTRSMASTMVERTACRGSSMPDDMTSVSRRCRPSRAELACRVHMTPSWPTFMAWSMSMASTPRTSPTMMRSGRMRRVLVTRSRRVTSGRPAASRTRVRRYMTWGWGRVISGVSSRTMTRSSLGMSAPRALRSVVLPELVPPMMRMLRWCLTANLRNEAQPKVMAPLRAISPKWGRRVGRLRMVTHSPPRTKGGAMTCTREPSTAERSA